MLYNYCYISLREAILVSDIPFYTTIYKIPCLLTAAFDVHSKYGVPCSTAIPVHPLGLL